MTQRFDRVLLSLPLDTLLLFVGVRLRLCISPTAVCEDIGEPFPYGAPYAGGASAACRSNGCSEGLKKRGPMARAGGSASSKPMYVGTSVLVEGNSTFSTSPVLLSTAVGRKSLPSSDNGCSAFTGEAARQKPPTDQMQLTVSRETLAEVDSANDAQGKRHSS